MTTLTFFIKRSEVSRVERPKPRIDSLLSRASRRGEVLMNKMNPFSVFTARLAVALCFCLMFALTPAISLAATTPDTDFIDNGDGTVTHKITGLTWKRCAEGQTWEGKTCTGDATTYTYAQALKLSSNFVGFTDWRVPTIAELHTIVEREKYQPAINITMFPNTPSTLFRSTSVYAYLPNGAWDVNFKSGFDYIDGNFITQFDDNKNSDRIIRLVRGGQLLDTSGEYTPTKDFNDHDNGTVTHKTTGLMWQRCALGQIWDGKTCTGDAAEYT